MLYFFLSKLSYQGYDVICTKKEYLYEKNVHLNINMIIVFVAEMHAYHKEASIWGAGNIENHSITKIFYLKVDPIIGN